MSKERNELAPHSRFGKNLCPNCGKELGRAHNVNETCSDCYKKTFNTERTCTKCRVLKPASEFTPTSRYCKSCLSTYTNHKWQQLKIDAIEYKGGKCIVCGYSKCTAALEFHHRDPLVKDFSISSVRTLKIESIIDELDKCDLLCSNCHREQHQVLSTSAKLTSE